MVSRRPVVIVHLTLVLAQALAGASIAVGQISLNVPGVSLGVKANETAVGLTGLNVLGAVSTTPAALSLRSNGIEAVLPGITVSNLAAVTPATVSVSGSGATVSLPGARVAGLVAISSATVSVTGNGATVTLPSASLGSGLLSVTPLNLNLGGQAPPIVPPAVTVGIPGPSPLTVLGSDALNQISPITQLFAGMGSAGVLAPVDQLVSGLSFANAASSGCAAADAGAMSPLPAANIWMWNASTIRQTDHDGMRINSSENSQCGSSLPIQTLERTNLPGILWDASSALGMKRGTFHLGFSGGPSETDTQVKANAILRDAGITQAAAVRLTSWSAGGFSLLTTDSWYAGSAVGGAWGRAESQNFVLGSASDYNTSTLVAAGFLGTILPLTDNVRFDMRGTLSYQRTVGEAHSDTLGIVYGDHTIEATQLMLSGRLFGVFNQGSLTIRPFLQTGITHNLHYNNQLNIDGIAFQLRDSDISVFIASGLDFEISNALQLSLGVRQEYGGDVESLSGRLGFTARLN